MPSINANNIHVGYMAYQKIQCIKDVSNIIILSIV